MSGRGDSDSALVPAVPPADLPGFVLAYEVKYMKGRDENQLIVHITFKMSRTGFQPSPRAIKRK